MQSNRLKNIPKKTAQNLPPYEWKPLSNHFVILRLWKPTFKNKVVSYGAAIFRSLFNTKKQLSEEFQDKIGSVGHFSLEIFNGEKEIIIEEGGEVAYVSHWPNWEKRQPHNRFVAEGRNNTLEQDLFAEGRPPDEYLVLYTLDTDKMIKKFKKLGATYPYNFLGQHKKVKPACNCSGMVYEILKEGGLLNYLLSEKDKIKNLIINPSEVFELAKAAKEKERLLHPITEFFFREDMLNLKKKFLENSLKPNRSLKDFIKFYVSYFPLTIYSICESLQVNEKIYQQNCLNQLLFECIYTKEEKNFGQIFFNFLIIILAQNNSNQSFEMILKLDLIKNNYADGGISILNNLLKDTFEPTELILINNIQENKDFDALFNMLLEYGANPMAIDKKGFSVLDYAILNHSSEQINAILKAYPDAKYNKEIEVTKLSDTTSQHARYLFTPKNELFKSSDRQLEENCVSSERNSLIY